MAHLLDSILLNLGAWILEWIVLSGMYAVYWLLARQTGGQLKPFADAFDPVVSQVVNGLIYVALAAPYFILGHARYGTTLGKKWLRIYVVTATSWKPITLRQSVIRFCAYLLSYLPVGAGFLMAAFQPQKRALHDLIAGTVSVIKER